MIYNKIFQSENENNYLISSEENNIIFIHPAIKQIFNFDLQGKALLWDSSLECREDEFEHYQNQYLFFKEKGWFKKPEHNFTSSLGLDNIVNKLANIRQVLFEVTDACNLNCKYCGYGELYSNYDCRNNTYMHFEMAKSLIDYLWQYWASDYNVSYNNFITLGFYGGEPLLNINLIRKIIAYVEEKNSIGLKFKYNMTTNAMLLHKYVDYLYDKNFSVLVSLDGDKYGNSYRITKNGQNSHSVIIHNVDLLKARYPKYFEEHITFNAVLHNRNSTESVVKYVLEKYNKIPRVSELNSNGIRKDKEAEYWQMFKDKFKDIEAAENCEELKAEIFYDNPEISNIDTFINQYSGNSFFSYNDLLANRSRIKYLPTGTCYPFQKKIFLTANGKILPCEKIGQEETLGHIENSTVFIDLNKIVEKYEKKYQDLIPQCKYCFRGKICAQCFYFLKTKNGKTYCPNFQPIREFNNYCSYVFSHLEKKPEIYEQLLTEIYLDV